jgi:hypothetical protein
MRKTLIAIAAAAALLPASAWANDDDYSLELHPAACKAATARIVEATGGVDTANPLAQPGFTIFKIPGDDPPNDFSIDCGSSPETITAYMFLGFHENREQWVVVAARIAHGLTGDRLSAAADAVERCLDSAGNAAQDVRASGHADLPKTHFECWVMHSADGLTAGVYINPRGQHK